MEKFLLGCSLILSLMSFVIVYANWGKEETEEKEEEKPSKCPRIMLTTNPCGSYWARDAFELWMAEKEAIRLQVEQEKILHRMRSTMNIYRDALELQEGLRFRERSRPFRVVVPGSISGDWKAVEQYVACCIGLAYGERVHLEKIEYDMQIVATGRLIRREEFYVLSEEERRRLLYGTWDYEKPKNITPYLRCFVTLEVHPIARAVFDFGFSGIVIKQGEEVKFNGYYYRVVQVGNFPDKTELTLTRSRV